MFDKVFDKLQNVFASSNSNSSNNPTKFKINGKDYYQEKLIAEGGYGYVYLVSDNNSKKYALKKMNILNPTQFQNIKHEIQIWKEINSGPNIVKMIDLSITEKEVDILMELCTDGSLLDHINNYQGDIPEQEALKIIKDICSGLNTMHSKNPPIAHRDIKIENVLKFGNTYKLCDFGSASTDVLNPNNVSKQIIRDKFDIYERNTTFMYRPPEMIDEYSKYIVNEKVDIWAVGCILFTILFKTQPFQDAQKLTICTGDYYMPKEAEKYSEKIFDFIRLLLTPNPMNRPNVQQVLNYINNWNGINKINLSDEVLEIKKRQLKIFNEKKNTKSGEAISMDDFEKAKLSIMKDLKKKNKYKKKDNSDINDLFDDGDEYYKSNPEKRNINNNNNNNLLNSSLTDNSSILDLKKFLNPNTSEKMDDEIEVDSFLFEDNKKNYFKYNNNEINNDSSIEPPKTKKINNNNINNNTKKRVGYVFEIKVENELKKLVLKKGEDKNIIVKNFCEKYGINEEEKTKIIKIIDERLKNYSASQNLL
jgi:AP2-associated kinase